MNLDVKNSSNIKGYLAHFPAPASKFFPKKIYYFFSKNDFFVFGETEFSNPKIRKFLILFVLSLQNFSPKNFLYFFLKRPARKMFLIFSQNKLFLKLAFFYFLKKSFPYISGKVYSEHRGIFRIRSIFRALIYSEPEVYSEYCETSTMERLAKIAT